MGFHDTPTIAAERTERRRSLMIAIAAFKRSSVVNPALLRQLEYSLAQLGGPIVE